MRLSLVCILLLTVETAWSQIRTNLAVGGQISTSSAFMDASSTSSWNSSVNKGKGLIFPRADLTTFTSMSYAGIVGSPINYPTRFDGMIVYNTGAGTASIGSTSVSQGFYYYVNKTTDVNGGTWVRLIDENDMGSDVTVYYGLLSTTTPTESDITALTTTTTTSGIYTSKFDQTLSSAGYYTVAVPVSWRVPLLTIDGDETFNVFLPAETLVINGQTYQVWQSDVSLISGLAVAVN